MELWERKDYIQIDYLENKGGFTVSRLADKQEIEKVNFSILKRFNDNLAAAIMFTVGAMSAIREFLDPKTYSVTGLYRPVEACEIIYTPAAMARIKSKKYRIAKILYPELKKVS